MADEIETKDCDFCNFYGYKRNPDFAEDSEEGWVCDCDNENTNQEAVKVLD